MKVTDFKTRFAQLKKTAPEALAGIRPGQRVFIGSGCGEPQHLVNTLLDRASGFSDLEIVRLLSLESSLVAMMAEESRGRIFNVRSIYLGSGQTLSLKANQRFITPSPLSAVPRILYPKFADFMEHGSEGGVYVSDNGSEEQRKAFDTLVTTNMGALFMKNIFEVKYVKIDIEEKDDTFKVKTPFGEMNQHQMKGLDGGPIRIENAPLPVLKNLKHCHTP